MYQTSNLYSASVDCNRFDFSHGDHEIAYSWGNGF